MVLNAHFTLHLGFGFYKVISTINASEVPFHSNSMLPKGFCNIPKGWPPIAKLEKIQDGIARFGCNLGDMIAYLCRLLTPVDTQIGQC